MMYWIKFSSNINSLVTHWAVQHHTAYEMKDSETKHKMSVIASD